MPSSPRNEASERRLPHWLTEVLDTDYADHSWQPPATLPTAPDLRVAIQICERTTEGRVTPAFARVCFAKMLTAFEPNSKPSGDETRLRMSVWLEACGDLNDALWAEATAEAIQSMKWMPKPAEFRALVINQVRTAHKRKERLRMMLDMVGKPTAKPFVREPDNVRIRGMRDSFRKVGDTFRAARYERMLAGMEEREPEAWATQEIVQPAPAPPPRTMTDIPKPSLEMRIALTRAAIGFHRDMGFDEIVAVKESELAAMEAELKASA